MASRMVTCEHCGTQFREKDQYAHYSGYYCSKECYDTLFLNCLECGEEDMTAKTNLTKHNEQLCMKCYDQKHGLMSVTIVSNQMPYGRGRR